MIIDLIFLPILFAVSYILGNFIQTRDLGFLNTIFSILGFIGVVIPSWSRADARYTRSDFHQGVNGIFSTVAYQMVDYLALAGSNLHNRI